MFKNNPITCMNCKNKIYESIRDHNKKCHANNNFKYSHEIQCRSCNVIVSGSIKNHNDICSKRITVCKNCNIKISGSIQEHNRICSYNNQHIAKSHLNINETDYINKIKNIYFVLDIPNVNDYRKCIFEYSEQKEFTDKLAIISFNEKEFSTIMNFKDRIPVQCSTTLHGIKMSMDYTLNYKKSVIINVITNKDNNITEQLINELKTLLWNRSNIILNFVHIGSENKHYKSLCDNIGEYNLCSEDSAFDICVKTFLKYYRF